MAVVINDFEVVMDPPAQQQPAATPGAAAAPAPAMPIGPAEMKAIAAHLARRLERVRAH